MKTLYEDFKTWCVHIMGDRGPWWMIPVGLVVLAVLVF
jgi:hypothetical protein